MIDGARKPTILTIFSFLLFQGFRCTKKIVVEIAISDCFLFLDSSLTTVFKIASTRESDLKIQAMDIGHRRRKGQFSRGSGGARNSHNPQWVKKPLEAFEISFLKWPTLTRILFFL